MHVSGIYMFDRRFYRALAQCAYILLYRIIVFNSVVIFSAFGRLALVLYDDQRFSAAEAALTKGTSGANEASSLGLPDLLLLSKAQVCTQHHGAASVSHCTLFLS